MDMARYADAVSRLARRLGALIVAAAAMVVTASPMNADCQGGPVWPLSAEWSRGETFIGVFERTETVGGSDQLLHWGIERVYAGDLMPGPTVWGEGLPSCHPIYFTEGVRYLVSSSTRNRDAFNVVAYRVLDGGGLRMHAFEGAPSDYPPELQVDTLGEALRVLVPGLPSTDTAVARAEPEPEPEGVRVFLVGAVAAIAAAAFTRRRKDAASN
jgi:hypothetical protein